MQLLPVIQVKAPSLVEFYSLQHVMRYQHAYGPMAFEVYSMLTNYENLPLVTRGMKNTVDELNLEYVRSYFSVPTTYHRDGIFYQAPREFSNVIFAMCGGRLPTTFESILLVKTMLDSSLSGNKLPKFSSLNEAYEHFGITTHTSIVNADDDELDIIYMSYPDAIAIRQGNKSAYLTLDDSNPLMLVDKIHLRVNVDKNNHVVLRNESVTLSTCDTIRDAEVSFNTVRHGQINLVFCGTWVTGLIAEISSYGRRFFHLKRQKSRKAREITVIPTDNTHIVTFDARERVVYFPTKRATGWIDSRPAVARMFSLLEHLT